MKATWKMFRPALTLVVAAGMLTACASMMSSSNANVTLSGANEVPAVVTNASGTAKFTVDRDWTVQGKVTTSGIVATAAHIHDGATGTNGPVAVPLTRTGEDEFSVPAGTRFTEGQFKSYREGRLYVNVHSAAHPGGEIRGQLTP